ncbi:MAG: hydroxymethylbilane synthase [Methanocorpusculum sp.]|nr:hydroxymethylbilane synthase [Methanocorpusculum sp.]
MSVIKIGTRGSKLALAQTNKVVSLLSELGFKTEVKIIKTKGDAVTDRGLHQIGSYGVFVRELDNAILFGEIDMAVHSMKDIPTYRPDGIITAAILKRDPPYDYMVTNKPMTELSVIGTSSLRRKAQLMRYYRDTKGIEIKSLRGNIDTRLAKLKAGEFEAILLAEAGLVRMNYRENGFRLSANDFVPAPNQGTVAVVCCDSPEIYEAAGLLNDGLSAYDTMMERAVMEEIGGGCFIPQGIYCLRGQLTAEILSLDGSKTERVSAEVNSIEEAREIGQNLKDEAWDLIAEAKAVCGDLK